jgi:DGQHR domain-containing protein
MAKKIKSSRAFSYQCLSYSQRGEKSAVPRFCLFHAPAGEILEWADIERLEVRPGGAQRALNDSRVRSLCRFLGDDRNTVPTAVIIALELRPVALRSQRGKGLSVLDIVFDGKKKPGVVIDGQHRLIGVREFDPAMNLNVVALLGCFEDETAFQFLVINNKAAKVSTDHIKALLAERRDAGLKERLRRARLTISPRIDFVSLADCDPESPFKSLIDWPTNRDGYRWIPPAAIELAIKDIQERSIPEFEDVDIMLEFFFTVWATICNEWSHLWCEGSKLLSKVGIACMTQFVTNSVVSSYDLGEMDVTDVEQVSDRTQQILGLQSPELWIADWSSAGYDTQAGRKLVLDALVQVARNVRAKRQWRSDVPLLSAK